MAFGINPECIFSTNIWLTGFRCVAILSFPLTLFNFLFVTSSPFQGRSCVPHLLQQYHLGLHQGQANLVIAKLTSWGLSRNLFYYKVAWNVSVILLPVLGLIFLHLWIAFLQLPSALVVPAEGRFDWWASITYCTDFSLCAVYFLSASSLVTEKIVSIKGRRNDRDLLFPSRKQCPKSDLSKTSTCGTLLVLP